MNREAILARKRENSRKLRANPEYKKREAEYAKSYIKCPKVKKKRVVNQIRYERKLKFGVTDEDYQRMRKEQNDSCAICGTDTPGGRGDWHIDHCHTSGKVRGLLCFPCNTSLGHFKDNIETLANAIAYLEKHKS